MTDPTPGLRLDGPRARRHRARLGGAGDRLLVLSHGLGTDQGAWDALRPWLEARFRVLSYDLPGAGPLLPEDFDAARYAHLSGFADDLLALLDEVGVVRCDLLAHSVSGMVGALAAIEEPSLFGQLVMINPSPRYLDEPGYTGGFGAADLEALFEAMRRNYEDWVAGFAPAVAGGQSPDVAASFAATLLAMRPDVTSAMAQAIFRSDLRTILPGIPVPVALVHSRHDIAVPAAVADYLLANIPRARRLWIESPGHLPHLSDPAAVIAALEQLL